jgi:outer membrane protein OmpA-like peptidoglycan-associated protein
MKKLLLTVAVLLCAFGAKAQYFNELAVEQQYPGDLKAADVYQVALDKQANKRTSALRTTWVANKPSSNWFLSLEGGLAWFGGENWDAVDLKDAIQPTVGISLGKWFTPVWGLRANIGGAKLKGYAPTLGQTWYVGWQQYKDVPGAGSSYYFPETKEQTDYVLDHFVNKDEAYKDGYRYDFTYAVATVDFLVNLKNFFRPYNPKGFFNPVLFAGVGYAYTFADKDNNRTVVNSIAAKTGLQFNFRLCDSWDLFLQGEAYAFPETFDRFVGGDKTQDMLVNAKLGLTYRFNFRHFIEAPLIDQAQLDALNNELNALRNRQVPNCPPVVPCPEPKETIKEVVKPIELTPVFFTIDSYFVRDNQLVSVAKAALYLNDNPSAKIEIAAYADKKTGNPAHNMKLSENRAKAVAKLLITKFGIDKSRITTSWHGDTIQPYAENDWNRVAIFVK